MKNKNWLISLLFLFSTLTINAQITPGDSCEEATCSIQGSYSSQTGSSSMGTFGCLYSTPNANWIAINTVTGGSVHYVLTQTNANGFGIDVDFAVYGPYNSVSDGCPITGSTPTVDCSYSASSTEYIDIPNAQAGDVYIILITNYNGSAGTISLNPNSSNPSTATVDCNINFSGDISSTPALCGQPTGSVSVVPIGGHPPYSYSWNIPGSPDAPTVNNVPPGTYSVTITSSPDPITGVTYIPTTLTVTVGNQSSTASATSTVASCAGMNDGTATATSTAPGTLTYQWNDPNNQMTQTAVGLAAGTYECIISSDTGCENTVSVVVGEIPGMQIQWTNVLDATCNSGSDGQATASVTQGTAPYFYSWSGSNSTAAAAYDLAFGTHTLTVTDAKGCIANDDVQINQPDALLIGMISADTVVCVGDTAVLTGQGSGGSSNYIYEWYEDGILLGNTQTITVQPAFESVEYFLVLKEECGSPADTNSVTVSWPDDVEILAIPDTIGGCHPVEITFENATSTADAIDYTVWKFSDGGIDTIPGNNPVTHTFGLGLWDVSMEVVTEYGCSHKESFPYIVEGYPYPIPNFYGNPSPVTMIDPVVQLYSQSSSDAANYTWYMEGGTPNYSTAKDPIVKYPTNIVDDYPVTLIIENEFHCVDSITRIISVVDEVLFFAPNSFTPDGDGYNENWRVHVSGIDIYNFNLQVFSRWGEIVFESNDANSTWDGTYGSKRLPEGTYIWRATATDYHNDNKYEFDGHVTILR